jgi:hypothetical protein
VNSYRPVDQCVEHPVINVVETFEVETSLPDLVRTKSLQQLWIPALDAADEVDDQGLLAR